MHGESGYTSDPKMVGLHARITAILADVAFFLGRSEFLHDFAMGLHRGKPRRRLMRAASILCLCFIMQSAIWLQA